MSCEKDDDLTHSDVPAIPVDTIPAPDTIPDTTPQPTADFLYNLTTSMVVTFANASSNATSYQWNFGDGSDDLEDLRFTLYEPANDTMARRPLFQGRGRHLPHRYQPDFPAGEFRRHHRLDALHLDG